MTASLRSKLSSICRLPEGFSSPSVCADVVDLGGVRVSRAGIAATTPEGLELTGSAAEIDGDPAVRAAFELVERVATVEAIAAAVPERHGVFPDSAAPDAFRHARSNGVALHTSHERAATRARWELAERDRVLRAWFGETRPERATASERSRGRGLLASDAFDVELVAFPDDGASAASSGVFVAGAFAFPRRPGVPLAMGFGARATEDAAIEAALAEALQSAAFLWGEPIPDADPGIGPSAMHHLEHWQWAPRHEALRRWLDGDHARFRGVLAEAGLSSGSAADPVVLHDLTPPWARPLHVARATCPSTIPLVFGTPPWTAALPPALRVHPIA